MLLPQVGLGIHGEPGRSKQALGTADSMVQELVQRILGVPNAAGSEEKAGESHGSEAVPEVALMVNNLGGSSVLELHVAARAAHRSLEAAGIKVSRTFTGERST